MDCRTALALIDAYLDGELDRTEARALEAHLDACPDCANALAHVDELRRLLREPSLRHSTPPELRARIRAIADAMAASADGSREDVRSNVVALTRRPRHAMPAWFGIAAACLLSFTAGGLVVRQGFGDHASNNDEAQFERDVFASHWRALAAASPVDVVSSDHHTVRPWFAGRIADSPPVHDFADEGFALVGGRIDYIGTRRVAVLVYRHGQHVIDVFVLPRTADDRMSHVESQGYAADALTIGSHHAIVVSDMDANEQSRFARMLGETR